MNQSPKSAGRKLAVCFVLTLVWLGIAIYLGYTARHPNDSCAGTFSCLTASEWGDFLAGVFAPTAFVWLVAAVWIQSDELREQRNELALTREEFKLNRSVLKQQAEEAKKQAEYISTQTHLLLEEASRQKATRIVESFDNLLRNYVEYTRDHTDDSWCTINDTSMRLFEKIPSRNISDERYIYDQYENIIYLSSDSVTITDFPNNEILGNAFVFIYSAEELIEKLPFHSRVSWKMSKLGPLIDGYCEIINRYSQFEELRSYVKERERRLGKTPVDLQASSPSPDV